MKTVKAGAVFGFAWVLLFALTFGVLLCVPAAAKEAEIPEGYTAISSAEDLLCIFDLSGKYILTQDIDLTDVDGCDPWTALGYNKNSTAQEEFTGVIDGNGYSIYGLNGSGGLVYINSGTVRNLTIASGTISGAKNIGTFCYRNNGLIENCVNRANVTASRADGTYGYVGGFCSYNYGTISGCVNTGTVNGSSYQATGYVGGIAGYSGNGSVITLCRNTGSLTMEPRGTISGFVGGIVGYAASASIYDVYNNGSLTCDAPAGSYPGEYVGELPAMPPAVQCSQMHIRQVLLQGTIVGEVSDHLGI